MTAKKSTGKPSTKKALPIESSIAYFYFGCQKVWINDGKICACSEFGEPSTNVDAEENFERVMLTLYKLAHMTNTKVPKNPHGW